MALLVLPLLVTSSLGPSFPALAPCSRAASNRLSAPSPCWNWKSTWQTASREKAVLPGCRTVVFVLLVQTCHRCLAWRRPCRPWLPWQPHLRQRTPKDLQKPRLRRNQGLFGLPQRRWEEVRMQDTCQAAVVPCTALQRRPARTDLESYHPWHPSSSICRRSMESAVKAYASSGPSAEIGGEMMFGRGCSWSSSFSGLRAVARAISEGNRRRSSSWYC